MVEYNINLTGKLKLDEISDKPKHSELSVTPFNVKLNDNVSIPEALTEVFKNLNLDNKEDVKKLDLNQLLAAFLSLKKEDDENTTN